MKTCLKYDIKSVALQKIGPGYIKSQIMPYKGILVNLHIALKS